MGTDKDTPSKPDISEFKSYREFLRSWILWRKSQSKFSYKNFAELAGLSSPSFLFLVLQGKRNIGLDTARKIATSLKLTKVEIAYFLDLVGLTQSHDSEDKLYYADRVIHSPLIKSEKVFDRVHYEFYASPLNILVRELVCLPAAPRDAKSLAARCLFPVKSKEIEKSLSSLTTLGFLKKNSEGALEQVSTQVSSGQEVVSVVLRNYQTLMMNQAAKSMDLVAADSREISSLTVRLSRQNAAKIKDKIRELKKEILVMEGQDSENAEEVYQLNFQLFPLTKPLQKK